MNTRKWGLFIMPITFHTSLHTPVACQRCATAAARLQQRVSIFAGLLHASSTEVQASPEVCVEEHDEVGVVQYARHLTPVTLHTSLQASGLIIPKARAARCCMAESR